MPSAEPLHSSSNALVLSLSLAAETTELGATILRDGGAAPQPFRTVSVHEWIPMGSLASRTECRCCHCGLTRTYDLVSAPLVSYSRYGHTVASGAIDGTDVPDCNVRGHRMPPVIAARGWDILSWGQS